MAELLIHEQAWPPLPLREWQDTCETLHLWTQVVGKVRLALSPHSNHWWEVPFYVNAHGLTTSAIPYRSENFEVQFDFIDHKLEILTSWGQAKTLPLAPCSVAAFYTEFMSSLHSIGIDVKIWPVPAEIPNPIRFDEDRIHASYDAGHAHRFWRILATVDAILKEFRGRFIGKASPVHFFWGSFDLAATRFSGRRAPPRPGADPITREAYSHEVCSAGFWPGSGAVQDPAFYCYMAPEPVGFSTSPIVPEHAFYHPDLHSFVLMYETIRTLGSPKDRLLEFLQSTYASGARLGRWDREALEVPAEERKAA